MRSALFRLSAKEAGVHADPKPWNGGVTGLGKERFKNLICVKRHLAVSPNFRNSEHA